MSCVSSEIHTGQYVVSVIVLISFSFSGAFYSFRPGRMTKERPKSDIRFFCANKRIIFPTSAAYARRTDAFNLILFYLQGCICRGLEESGGSTPLPKMSDPPTDMQTPALTVYSIMCQRRSLFTVALARKCKMLQFIAVRASDLPPSARTQLLHGRGPDVKTKKKSYPLRKLTNAALLFNRKNIQEQQRKNSEQKTTAITVALPLNSVIKQQWIRRSIRHSVFSKLFVVRHSNNIRVMTMTMMIGKNRCTMLV